MGSSNISAKSAGQEEFEFLQGLWGSGGGAGGGTATATGATSTAKGSAAGVGATIGGAIATLIGSIVSDSGSNFRTKDKGNAGIKTGTQEAVKEQTISQGINQLGQLTAMEQWAQDQVSAQPWDKKVVRNAIPKPDSAIQGVKPIEQTNVKSQYGYRPTDLIREEDWAKQGTINGTMVLNPPQTGVIADPIPNAGDMTGAVTGDNAGSIAGQGVAVGQGTITAVGTDGIARTIEKVDAATKEPGAINPIETPPIKIPPGDVDLGSSNNMEENVQQINYNNLEDVLKYLEEAQAKQWAREDAIRKEVQEREDSAYTRAVADMRRSGVNPNLVGVNPAESGGGITNATGMDFSMFNNMYTAETNKYIKELELALEMAFKEDNNEKNRITDLITGLISSFGSMISAGILAMK